MADRPQDSDNSAAESPKKQRKPPRKVTKDRLRNIALYHLERFATSANNLKQVLYRRSLKAAKHHETDMEEARAWIDEVVGALVRSGAIDDSKYANGKTVSMLRRGQSPRKVRAYLASKGIDGELIDAALSAASEEFGDVGLQAATSYAVRRRLGPFRTEGASQERKQKELAILGRAGFQYSIARKIVDAESEDDLAPQ